MNDLQKQVHQAQRRLNFQQFLSVVFWFLLAAFSVAAVGVAIPKVWHLSVDGNVWQWSWIGGSVAAGIFAATVWTVVARQNSLDAAIELDKRFGLKERVSSVLALTENEKESEAGQALINDAVRRVAEVDVKEKFQVTPNRWAWAPFVMAGVVFGLTFLSDAQPEKSNATAATVPVRTKVNKKSTEDLKKKLAERKKKAIEEGLEEATEVFKKLEMSVDNLRKKNSLGKKEALVKLNDLTQELKQRKSQLGDPDKLRNQLNQLKDLKQGPADKMAKALKAGDFKGAMEAVEELQKNLMNGKMTEEQKKQLQEQLAQMKDKLQQMVDQQKQMQQDLERKLQQKLAQGDRQGAAEIQKKLDKMQMQAPQMNKLEQMAQQLGDAQQSMKQGNAQQAAQQLSELADGLQSMQDEFEELELLDDALAQIGQAKDSMNCENCNGAGCSMCQGMGGQMGDGMGGMGDQFSDIPGMGMGQGRGQGDRPEQESGTDFYDSQVRAKPGRGKHTIIGSAGGPNKPGQAFEELKSEIETAKKSDDDPLTGVRLPKAQRELTKQYFDSFRDGK